jgi:pheromone shutdown protein TraB
MEKIVNDNIILIGTAHVSKKSVAEVHNAIEKYQPDIVGVELCEKRYEAITKKNRWEKTDIAEVLRSGKGFLLLVQTFLAMIQRKMGKEFGVEPGAEMLAAIKEAKKHNLKVALVDRDITITFRRAWRLMTFREKMRLFWYSMKALIGYDRIQEELEEELAKKEQEEQEKKKQMKGDEKTDESAKKTEPPTKDAKEAALDHLMKEDVISAMMEELRKVVPNATKALIDERDQYISIKILDYVNGTDRRFITFSKKKDKTGKPSKSKGSKQAKEMIKTKEVAMTDTKKPEVAPTKKKGKRKILAVVGAGHLNGIKKNLAKPEQLPDLKTITTVPKKRVSVLKVIGYLIPILFATLFVYLVIFGEWNKLFLVLVGWFLINGISSAIGAAIALGHPLTILTAFVAAPLTSLNPAIGAGWVAGYVELKVRTPTVKDIRNLSKIEEMKDFFSNRVIKVLMVMALANLGSMIGTFIAIAYIGKVV